MIDVFYYSVDDFNPKLWYAVWSELEKLSGYFYRVCRKEADDAKIYVFEHAIQHYSPDKGNLNAYLRKLTQTVLKPNSNFVSVDTVIIDATVEEGAQRLQDYVGQHTEGLEVQIEDSMVDFREKYEKVASLALSNMRYFIMYAKQVIDKDTTSNYFPDTFKKETYKCFNFCKKDFHKLVLKIYNDHRSGFEKFMEDAPYGRNESYKELDIDLINKSTSKRIVLVEKGTDNICTDPDAVEWEVSGALGNRRVIKVPYRELYDMLCDLVDEDGCNAIKYTLGETYIFRTLGGSLSLTNLSLFSMYSIIKNEILTNLIYDYGARILSVGSENVYLLQSPIDGRFKEPIDRVIRGIELKFRYIDVTPDTTIS